MLNHLSVISLAGSHFNSQSKVDRFVISVQISSKQMNNVCVYVYKKGLRLLFGVAYKNHSDVNLCKTKLCCSFLWQQCVFFFFFPTYSPFKESDQQQHNYWVLATACWENILIGNLFFFFKNKKTIICWYCAFLAVIFFNCVSLTCVHNN